jgi:glyoxylase-like metal-dependent hydrolase (beta-lactamase superfamily II)
MSGPSISQVATNTYLVDSGLVNWVVVAEGDSLLLVDAGFPGHRRAVEESIRMIGYQPGQLVAVLLTHAHADHIGGVPQLVRRYPIPVLTHPAEVAHARGGLIESVSPLAVLRNAWRPGFPRFGLACALRGGLSHVRVPATLAFPAGEALDLPGRPVPVPLPGHTSGHCGYLLPDAGAVITGDALVTGHATSQEWGPQLLAPMFNTDHERAVRTLDKLADLDADLLLPGHGTAYCGSLPDAVALARARAETHLIR